MIGWWSLAKEGTAHHSWSAFLVLSYKIFAKGVGSVSSDTEVDVCLLITTQHQV